MTRQTDVVVIGAGQAGLAAGYYLRRKQLDFAILDAQGAPGGAWQRTWDSLHLFSPAGFSSLPGRLMPAQPGQEYPDARHVVDYLSDYEQRYDLPVHRPVHVRRVLRDGKRLQVEADTDVWSARAVISATGTWWRPFLPATPGRNVFAGRELHTTGYRRPSDFAGQRVVVVGGGNSGAQIAADLATHESVDLTWVTQRPPRFLADDIDGRALFDAATARRRALDEGRSDTGGVASPGDIVAVPPVREARDAGLLKASRCSLGSSPTASSGPTALRPKPTPSSGALASDPPCPTSPHWAFGDHAAISPPTVRGRSRNRACICSATATGLAPPRQPSSAPAAQPVRLPQRLPSFSAAEGRERHHFPNRSHL